MTPTEEDRQKARAVIIEALGIEAIGPYEIELVEAYSIPVAQALADQRNQIADEIELLKLAYGHRAGAADNNQDRVLADEADAVCAKILALPVLIRSSEYLTTGAPSFGSVEPNAASGGPIQPKERTE